ncbi:MAG: WxcM-like domain-containing protein [Bacteroidales bacterium]|nr:WxcM-like domain-containing protein [Bacteroidales bacterium]
MGSFKLSDCRVIELERHHGERRGDISVFQNDGSFPFEVKRVYYLYDVPGGASRGAHAHKALYQLIIAVSGSFNVTLDDGDRKQSFFLNRPYLGLLVYPGIWRELDDFSSGAVCMVLASDVYSKEDYIRDYQEFLLYKKTEQQ